MSVSIYDCATEERAIAETVKSLGFHSPVFAGEPCDEDGYTIPTKVTAKG